MPYESPEGGREGGREGGVSKIIFPLGALLFSERTQERGGGDRGLIFKRGGVVVR